MTPMLNSVKPRKNLATQLDRLDRILDGLADSLSAAVSDCVREAVTVVVKQAITDVLTNPELCKRLHEVHDVTAPANPKNSFGRRIGQTMRSVWNRAKSAAKAGGNRAKTVVKACYNRTSAITASGVRLAQTNVQLAMKWVRVAMRLSLLLVRQLKGLVWRFRMPLLLAAGVGVVIGLCCNFATAFLAALAAGVSCGGVAGTAARRFPSIEQILRKRRLGQQTVQA